MSFSSATGNWSTAHVPKANDPKHGIRQLVFYHDDEKLIVANGFKPLHPRGTPNTNWYVTEFGDCFHRTTVLTAGNNITISVGGAGNLGVGTLVYTFPTINMAVTSARFRGSLTAAVTPAATPVIGLGSTIASGAVAVLNGTPAFHNIINESTSAALNGTDMTRVDAHNGTALLSTSNPRCYLNLAHNWAAADTITVNAGFQIIINWESLDAFVPVNTVSNPTQGN